MNTMLKQKQKFLIDMIGITQPIEEVDRRYVIRRLHSKEMDMEYKRTYLSTKKKDRYKNNYTFLVHDKTKAKVSAVPRRMEHNFIRAEFNPSKLEKIGRKKVRNFLIKILGIDIVKRIYFHSPITRIDLALDIYDMENDLYVYLPQFKNSIIIRKEDGSDKMLSQIIGKSRIRLTMYDKLEEQGIEDSAQNYQRLEIRFRDLRCSMHELTSPKITKKLLRPFNILRFYRSSFIDDNRFSEAFINKAKEMGLSAAIYGLDDNMRRRYRRYLEQHRVYPISTKNLNIAKARSVALNSLVHKEYRDQFIEQKQ